MLVSLLAYEKQDENAVEAALLYNDKKFPPLLPRKLRVMRAKGMKRNASNRGPTFRPNPSGVYNPKTNTQAKSMHGRASKMLGRAGAALMKREEKGERPPVNIIANGIKAPGN